MLEHPGQCLGLVGFGGVYIIADACQSTCLYPTSKTRFKELMLTFTSLESPSPAFAVNTIAEKSVQLSSPVRIRDKVALHVCYGCDVRFTFVQESNISACKYQ